MDNIGKLLLFRDVVEQGGFSKAAAVRGLNHSTVSKHIKSLEAELDLALLHRTSRTLSLTDEGRLVLQYSQQVGAQLDELSQRLEAMRAEVRGDLTINSLVHVGRHLVQPAIATFLREFPQARVKLILDDGPLHFSRDGYDLAVRVGRHAEGSLTARKLIDNKVCLAAAPSLLEEHGHPKHPADLRRYPTVAYASREVEIRTWPYLEKGEYRSVEVDPVCLVNDGNSLLEAVRAGLGVGYLSAFAARDDIDAGRLVRVLPKFALPAYEPVFMINATSEYTPPKLSAFKRHLMAIARSRT